jgi:hypothetical protein
MVRAVLVLLPGFQKGRDIKRFSVLEKGREQFWPKKGQQIILHCTRKNFKNEKNETEFHTF